MEVSQRTHGHHTQSPPHTTERTYRHVWLLGHRGVPPPLGCRGSLVSLEWLSGPCRIHPVVQCQAWVQPGQVAGATPSAALHIKHSAFPHWLELLPIFSATFHMQLNLPMDVLSCTMVYLPVCMLVPHRLSFPSVMSYILSHLGQNVDVTFTRDQMETSRTEGQTTRSVKVKRSKPVVPRAAWVPPEALPGPPRDTAALPGGEPGEEGKAAPLHQLGR